MPATSCSSPLSSPLPSLGLCVSLFVSVFMVLWLGTRSSGSVLVAVQERASFSKDILRATVFSLLVPFRDVIVEFYQMEILRLNIF